MLTDAQIKTLLDIANVGAHKGLVTLARQIYNGILVVKPGYVPALIGMAVSHIVVNQFAEAEELLKDTILKKSPNDVDALVMLGLTYMLSDRYDQAKTTLKPLVADASSAGQLARDLLEKSTA